MLPQPGLPPFHGSVLGGHMGNASATGLLSNAPNLIGNPGSLNPPTGIIPATASGVSATPPSSVAGIVPRPFPLSIPNTTLQSETSPHSNHSTSPVSSQNYFPANSTLPSGRVKRSNTPSSENSTGSMSPVNTTGSDCETGGSCRCGIINCIAGTEHRGHDVPGMYVGPPSPQMKVEGLTGVYTPTATTVPPSTLLIPMNNNNSLHNKNKDVTVINETPAPKLFKPYKSDIVERA